MACLNGGAQGNTTLPPEEIIELLIPRALIHARDVAAVLAQKVSRRDYGVHSAVGVQPLVMQPVLAGQVCVGVTTDRWTSGPASTPRRQWNRQPTFDPSSHRAIPSYKTFDRSNGRIRLFDSGSQAIKALMEEGIYIVSVNPNIATIATSQRL